MTNKSYAFHSKVWMYPGKAAWHFITIPQEISQDLKLKYGNLSRGWGSIPVNVTLINNSWNTSIFPDKKSSSYLLPIKKSIRLSEDIVDGDMIAVELGIRL